MSTTTTGGITAEQMIQAANRHPSWASATVVLVVLVAICLAFVAVLATVYVTAGWVGDRCWNAYMRWTWRRLPGPSTPAVIAPSRMVTNIQPIRRPYDQDAEETPL